MSNQDDAIGQREDIDDELFRDEDEDQALDDLDPGLESDEDIDDEVDAEGASAIRKRSS